MTELDNTNFGRRAIVRGAAWSIPATVVTAAAPVFAASKNNNGGGDTPVIPSCPAHTLRVASRIVFTDEDYSRRNFDEVITQNDDPQADIEMQHWYDSRDRSVNWRLVVGLLQGAQPGAKITIPKYESWTKRTEVEQRGVLGTDSFQRFMPALFAAEPFYYHTDLPTAAVSETDDAIVLTFADAIPTNSAGLFRFGADATVGHEGVLAGCELFAKAIIEYVPLDCETVYTPITR